MTNPSDRVEIITSVQRRGRWTASQKVQIVESSAHGALNAAIPESRFGRASLQITGHGHYFGLKVGSDGKSCPPLAGWIQIANLRIGKTAMVPMVHTYPEVARHSR
jgi:hypothetical protein